MKTRTLLFHVFSWLLVISMLAACAPKAATQAPASSGGGGSDAMSALVDAAKKEGTLTTIALPHDWCNYGGVQRARPNGGRAGNLTYTELCGELSRQIRWSRSRRRRTG